MIIFEEAQVSEHSDHRGDSGGTEQSRAGEAGHPAGHSDRATLQSQAMVV